VRDEPVRPFNSIDLRALLEIELSRLFDGGFLAWTAARSSVLIEIVSVENFPTRHLRFLSMILAAEAVSARLYETLTYRKRPTTEVGPAIGRFAPETAGMAVEPQLIRSISP
jgi:hypothetical protein